MTLTTLKGTHDLLPEDLAKWQAVESTLREVFRKANVREIRTPIMEYTELFERGVGEGTDIVNKEMYSFEKEGRLLTLRPENTAGVVRSYIQHGMDRWPKPVKLFYIGPMFRYERPQAGRQRQFHQAGVEVFGVDTPASDASVIALAKDLFTQLGLDTALDINNVGCPDCRTEFRDALREVIRPYFSRLSADSQTRFDANPLRMLDSKDDADKAVYAEPDVAAFLAEDRTCEACRTHFTELQRLLSAMGIDAKHNRMLVRGLDYYTRTVFEFTATGLGSQNAVCGGGRYNGLIKTLGGPDTPAVGWALGMERLISLVNIETRPVLDYFVASDDTAAALALVRQLQTLGYSADLDVSGKAFGKQLALGAKLNAQYALLLGDAERAANQVTRKRLSDGTQETLDLKTFLAQLMPASAVLESV